MLEIKDATFAVATDRKIRNLSFVANNSEVTAITGRSGSGKTRLLEAMLGFFPLDSGFVTVNGELLVPATANFFRSKIAYVPQSLRLPSRFTASDMYKQLVTCCGVKGNVPTKEQIVALWNTLHLNADLWDADLAKQPLSVLKRLMLVFALLSCRNIIVVDDPTAFQTDEDVKVMLRLLRAAAERGAVVVVASKDERVEQMADKCVVV